MPTTEQTLDMQRSTIERLRDEVVSLEEELEDYREVQRQRLVAQHVGFSRGTSWSQPLVVTVSVAFIATVAIEFYHTLAPGVLGKTLTIATMALLAFGITYGVQRQRLTKRKEYVAEYRRRYGSAPRFVTTILD